MYERENSTESRIKKLCESHKGVQRWLTLVTEHVYLQKPPSRIVRLVRSSLIQPSISATVSPTSLS